ncbi:VOC family protein [Solirubrobacter soli]|uniref:VOC family protein n=1 Tax=Solirubrobacter soli TaxID=363832 RepID=UPI0003F4C147|nr:VOC family protein [Solirubrobacter soli]
MLRFEHVGVVVDDLDAVGAFFLDLGFESDGRMHVDGEVVDRINGLDGVRAELMMVRTPDRTCTLELVKYHAPASGETPQPAPSNRLGLRHLLFEVDDLDRIVDGMREKGFDTVGEVQDYGTSWRLCYLRGPEGLIIELAQKL